MFPLLTKYLFHYKKVSIPNVGSFSIEHHPAELNFIDRLLMPPHYKIVFNDGQELNITCLMINQIENTLEMLLRREAEKHFKLLNLI